MIIKVPLMTCIRCDHCGYRSPGYGSAHEALTELKREGWAVEWKHQPDLCPSCEKERREGPTARD